MQINEKRILVFTSAAHYLTHFFILVFPAIVMPISRDLGIPLDQVISIGFPMYLCYGILAMLWGYLSDRIGPRLIMGTGIIISGIGFIAAGESQSVFSLTIFFGLVGVGCSAYHPSGLALLTKGIMLRGRALGINGLYGNLGIASAPLAAGILSYAFGWRSALIVFGCVGIIIGISSIAVPFSVSREDELQKGTPVERIKAKTVFLILLGVMLFSGLMYRGFTVILPAFFEYKIAGIDSALSSDLIKLLSLSAVKPDTNTLIATIITAGVYVIGMFGQLIGGYAADRTDLRWAYLGFFTLAAPFLLLLSFTEGFRLVILAGLFALFALGMQPIENSLIAIITPPKWRSLSYGIKFMIVFGAGSIAVQLISLVEKKYGLNYVMVFPMICLAFVLLMIILLLALSRGVAVKHEN